MAEIQRQKRARSENPIREDSYLKKKFDESNKRASERRAEQIQGIDHQLEELKNKTIESEEVEANKEELIERRIEAQIQEHFATTEFPRWFYKRMLALALEIDDDTGITMALAQAPPDQSALAIATKIFNMYKPKFIAQETYIEGGRVFLKFQKEEDAKDFQRKYKGEFGEASKVNARNEPARYTLVVSAKYGNLDIEKLHAAVTIKAGKAPINIYRSEKGYHFINFDDQVAMKKAGDIPLIPIKEVSNEIVGEFLETYEASSNIYNNNYVLYIKNLPIHNEQRIIKTFKAHNINVLEVYRKKNPAGRLMTYGYIAFATPEDARQCQKKRFDIFAKPYGLRRAFLHEQFKYWIDDWHERAEEGKEDMEVA